MNADKIIEQLGGTNELAERCELTPSAVSQWRTNGIPKPWLKLFREWRPDVFTAADNTEDSDQ